MAKTKVKSTPVARKNTAPQKSVPAAKAAATPKVEAKVETPTESESGETPLTGKALLQKVKELSHLTKRETAKQCGYVKTSPSGATRTNLSGFYDAVLAAKGVKLDEASKDGRGKVATFKATVHKNGQLLIGAAYTREMGLKEGDTFTIKLGYKHIHLIQDN